MKHLGKIVSKTLWLANLALILAMLFSAWSPWLIDPREYPLLGLSGFLLPFFFVGNLAFVVLWILFKWKYALFSLVAFIACQGQLRAYCPLNFGDEEIPAEAIKVLSYNVMGFDKLLKDDTEDKNPVLAYLNAQNADILCLQEFRFRKGKDPLQLSEEDIRKALRDYPYYVCLHTNGRTPAAGYLAVFSKFPVLSSESIPLGESANGASMHEILVYEDTVTLVNCHLESNKLTREDKVIYEEMIKNPERENVSEGAKVLLKKLGEATAIRASQADGIAEILREKAHPAVIICGDFNDIPVSYTHRILKNGRKDAYTEGGLGLGISYNQNKFYFRIDNILASDHLKTVKSRVDSSIDESDHYPIWAWLLLKKH